MRAAIGATIGYGNVVDGDGDVDANVCNAAHDEDGDDDSKVRDYDYSCDCSVVYEEGWTTTAMAAIMRMWVMTTVMALLDGESDGVNDHDVDDDGVAGDGADDGDLS